MIKQQAIENAAPFLVSVGDMIIVSIILFIFVLLLVCQGLLLAFLEKGNKM